MIYNSVCNLLLSVMVVLVEGKYNNSSTALGCHPICSASSTLIHPGRYCPNCSMGL